MTRKTLAIACAIGALIWSLIIYAIHRHTQSWADTGTWMVLIVVGTVLTGAAWLGAERDQANLDYEEELRRAAEGLDLEDEEGPPKRAA